MKKINLLELFLAIFPFIVSIFWIVDGIYDTGKNIYERFCLIFLGALLLILLIIICIKAIREHK